MLKFVYYFVIIIVCESFHHHRSHNFDLKESCSYKATLLEAMKNQIHFYALPRRDNSSSLLSTSVSLNQSTKTITESQISRLSYLFHNQQSVIVLVGLPGCGKSTLASHIINSTIASSPNAYSSPSSSSSIISWASVNQDVYKSRGRTLEVAEEYLLQGRSVIIDRCNFDAKQRQTWIELSRKFKLPCIALTLPHYDNVTYCSTRATQRGNDGIHEENADWNRICNAMKAQFRLPSIRNEGINVNIICRTDADLELLKHRVFPLPPDFQPQYQQVGVQQQQEHLLEVADTIVEDSRSEKEKTNDITYS